MKRPRSLSRIILVGLILSAIPAMSVARLSLAAPNVTHLIIPATLTQNDRSVRAKTLLNSLNLSKLAGTKDMIVGDVIYVHLNISTDQSEPPRDRVEYPFAISRNRPQRSDIATTSLRAIVSSHDNERLSVRYLFENLPSRKSLLDAVPTSQDTEAEILLTVNQRAIGHIKNVTIDGQIYEMR